MNEERNVLVTSDAIKYRKDCRDFVCLQDGTMTGDYKYCNLSTQCRQIDFVDGRAVPMENHYCPVVDPETHEVLEWQYYCTGHHDKRPFVERADGDEKVT